MTNKPTIDGVSRELIELAVEYLKIHGERSSIEYSTAEDLQALLDAKPRIILSGEPVAVVLPERMQEPAWDNGRDIREMCSDDSYVSGWNACLDATAALNETPKQ